MAKATEQSVEVVELNTDQVIEILQDPGSFDFESLVASPDEVSKAIVGRILNSEDADAVLAPLQETTKARDIMGQPMTITGVRWLASKFNDNESSLPVYALIEAKNLIDGEDMVVSCGALQVMAQLGRFAQLGSFPVDAQFGTTEKPTANGYYPIWLERAVTA